MTKLTGGEAVVQSLLRHGVDTLFALPGVQNDYLFNALHDAGDKIRVIHTRHEQGAAYMALGYAMALGKPGVYNVVPGAGFLNTTCALSTAYGTNAKLFCLTGEVQSDMIGRGYGLLHEIPDQLGIMRSLTKWAGHVGSPAEAPMLIAEAFRQMENGRSRPVGIQIPMDVLSKKQPVDLNVPVLPSYNPPVDLEEAEKAAKLLGNAKKPLIFVGGGAIDAAEEVRQLAEMLEAPVIAYSMGKGVMDSRHYLSQSYLAGYNLWDESDAVLVVGSRMSRPFARWGVEAGDKLIKIDVDPEEHGRSPKTAVSLIADAQDALQAVIELVGKHNISRPSRKEEMAQVAARVQQQMAHLAPQNEWVQAIRTALPEDGIFVDEVTQIGFASRLMMDVYEPRTFISPGYQGTLGWGFATALGVKVAQPDKPVLSVTGDGGFMFTMQELSTAVQNKIGLVTVIFNDGAFGNVRRMQKQLYDNRLIASNLYNPDFVKLAESFGAQGLRADSADALRAAIAQGVSTPDVPTLIDVPVGEFPNPWPLIMNPAAYL